MVLLLLSPSVVVVTAVAVVIVVVVVVVAHELCDSLVLNQDLLPRALDVLRLDVHRIGVLLVLELDLRARDAISM